MDPQIQSVITSAGVLLAGGIATWAASRGLVDQNDQAGLTNGLVTVGGAAAAGVFVWWKARAHSPAAAIQAVNAADNGVKVVAASSPSPQINVPLKS
jgi:hypothetical protein